MTCTVTSVNMLDVVRLTLASTSSMVANNDVMFVASNGSLVVRLSLVDHGGTHLTGTYQCHVTNGYSTATAYARLYVLGAKRTYY